MGKLPFVLVLLALAALAQAQPVPTAAPQAPASVFSSQLDIAMAIIGAIMAALIALAAAVYALGTLFGAETQARASTWAKSMLMAVGVAAVLLRSVTTTTSGRAQNLIGGSIVPTPFEMITVVASVFTTPVRKSWPM